VELGVVQSHQAQPGWVLHTQVLQTALSKQWVLFDANALLDTGRLGLQGQLVLQARHADVHGQRGVDEGIDLAGLFEQQLADDPAQKPAQQGMTGAVA